MNAATEKNAALFACACGGAYEPDGDCLVCGACGKRLRCEENIVHFIGDAEKRPYWAEQLDAYYPSGIVSDMQERYASFGGYVARLPQAEAFFDFALGAGNLIVDLASGPSGYFAPLLERLRPRVLFLGTDACRAVVNGHAAVNRHNPQFLMLDVDLDRPLPFHTASVDAFTGFLTSNVTGYRALLDEAARCLKPGGRFAVAEIFFERGNATWRHLTNEGAVHACLEDYIEHCRSIDLIHLGGELVKAVIGKLDPEDLYPLDNAEQSEIRTVFFEKAARVL